MVVLLDFVIKTRLCVCDFNFYLASLAPVHDFPCSLFQPKQWH